MYILVDNYDSFTYNLYHYLEELGAPVQVHRNDAITVEEIAALKPRGIILSPGPCTPDEAGICLSVVRELQGLIPILGVCLGHQTIGKVYGGRVIRAPQVMHGKTSPISHTNEGVFKALPSPMTATRYHSLIVEEENLPATLAVTARSDDDNLIMGLSAHHDCVHGVQFHPESIASDAGHDLLKNFLTLADGFEPKGLAA